MENAAGGGNQQYLTAAFTVVDTVNPQLESVVLDSSGGDNGQLRIIFDEGMDTNSITNGDIATKLSLNNGHVLGTTPTRTWSGTPTNTLTINLDADHTVAAGDILTIGAITDLAGNSANGANLAVAQTPGVVNITATSGDGDYKIGETVTVQVEFNPAVIVAGTPTLTLETGSTDRTIDFVSSSAGGGGTFLFFDYVVQAGDENTDLEYVSVNSLVLPDIINDTIKDQYGNNADLTLPTIAGGNSLSDNKDINVDGVKPTFTAQRTAENTVTVTFDENVDATVADELTAWTVAGATVTAVSDPADSNSLTITTSGLVGTDATPSVSYIAANGTVADMVGNALEDASKTAADLVAPALSSAKFTADNQITVIFSEIVTALAGNFINLETLAGAADLSVASISGSNSDTVVITLNENLSEVAVVEGGPNADTSGDAYALSLERGVIDDNSGSFYISMKAPVGEQIKRIKLPFIEFDPNVITINTTGISTVDSVLTSWTDPAIADEISIIDMAGKKYINFTVGRYGLADPSEAYWDGSNASIRMFKIDFTVNGGSSLPTTVKVFNTG